MTREEVEIELKEMFKGKWDREDLFRIASEMEPSKERTLDEVTQIASLTIGIPIEDIMKKKGKGARNQENVRARMLCYGYFRSFGYTLSYIGSLFNGRDHATVLNGLRMLEKDLDSKYKPTVSAFNKFQELINA